FKYGSSDAGVATVGDDGTVAVQGSGEAAITVWDLSRVAFARVSSPFPATTASGGGAPLAERFAQAPRRSFIDEIVLKKLQTLGIPPAGLCSDSEFIRRATLDATGVLPTPTDV